MTQEGTRMMEFLVKKAQTSFLTFCYLMSKAFPTTPPITISKCHDFIIHLAEACATRKISPRQCVSMPPQHGKALEDSTAIPTPSGFKPIGGIGVGDTVFAPDGTQTTVSAVAHWEDRQLYRLTMDDGATIVADAEHEWDVSLSRKRRNVFTTHTTEALYRRTSRRSPMLPPVSPVEYSEKMQMLPAYILGCWLGDGTQGLNQYTADEADQPHYFAKFESLGFTCKQAKSTPTRFSLVNSRWVAGWLRSWGLGKQKFIPRHYLLGSVEQRKELLRGLIDTDGHVAPDGQVEFCNTNKTLAEDVLQLVHSLGIKASMILGRATLNGRDCGLKYRVMFYAEGVATIPRKVARTRKPKKACRYIENIEKLGKGKTTCIEVLHPTHRFLAGKTFIPTHNSTFLSILFPLWLLGSRDGISIAITGFSHELVTDFSAAIKNLMACPLFNKIFPNCHLVMKANRLEYWRTTNGGVFRAKATGKKLTGRKVDVLIADDVFAGREEAESANRRRKIRKWFFSDCISRLSPDSMVFVIACMTGDTPVLMEDGTEKLLRDIKIGDRVASYKEGKLTSSSVLNWINHRNDKVVAITMSCGRVVKANERHPFLVNYNGKLQWIRLRNLKIGDQIVRLSQSGEHGEEPLVPMRGVTNPQNAKACATPITSSGDGRLATEANLCYVKRAVEPSISGTDMELNRMNTMLWLSSRGEGAPSVENSQPLPTAERIIGDASALTTTTAQRRLEDSSATVATSPSDTVELQKPCSEPSITSEFTTSQIVALEPAGEEDVFDIEVEGTENFIANGLVSHNTRWHPEDLIGHLTSEEYNERQDLENDGNDKYGVTNLSAVCDDPMNDPLGREQGEPLFPEVRTAGFLRSQKAGMPIYDWESSFMGRPRTSGSGQVDTSRLERIKITDLPKGCEFVRGWDLALSESKVADFTVGALVAYHKETDTLYIVDIIRERMAWPLAKKRIIDTALKDSECFNLHRIGIEGVSGFGIAIEEIRPLLRQHSIIVEKKNPVTDKLLRAQPWFNKADAGKVVVVAGRWNREFFDEMDMFPDGSNDDQVDGVSIAYECFTKRARLLYA